MRVTTSMYYNNIYGEGNALLGKNLFDVNKQIASGLNIQYAHDDVRTFSETMRLDNEITTLGQAKNSVESAFKMSDQTDAVLNEFETSMNRARTLLVNAANGSNSETSLDAIAEELRSIEDSFKNLSNTSINGQYLFSGSATDVRPIADDGSYMGNDGELRAFTGSKTSQQYNISGDELFLGEKKLVQREITTNVVQENLLAGYPALQTATDNTGSSLSGNSTIREMMGDKDSVVDTVNDKHFFYINGTRSDGTSFKEKIPMKDNEKVSDLLNEIGDLYGNTPEVDVVNVSMNQNGQIVIEDKIKGSSKIDFHMVGATDFDLTGSDAANVTNIDDLGAGETSFDKIMLGTSTAGNANLHVKEFIKSSLSAADGVVGNTIEGTIYDRTEFSKDGARLSSASPQIIRETNAFATPSTKLSEVADISQGTVSTLDDGLDGTSFMLEGTDINGATYSAKIDLAAGGSTFMVGANTYNIFDMGSPRAAVGADDMTYKQLMDVMNMVVTGNLPTPAPAGTSAQYDVAIEDADLMGRTFLSHDGKIQFEEIGTGNTKAAIALYDANSGDFTADASVMTFNANNAITVHDPKTDFFKTLDEIITSVENYKLYPDSSSGDIRNVGIENAIAMMDDLQDHVFRAHSQVGAQSNALRTSLERTELLEISSKSLRSSVVDTDLAEAYLTLAQLDTNYQAMLSTVSKISQLSLVNYL